jgi:hypothetical protein
LDAELLRAPDFVKELLSNIDEQHIERIQLDVDAINLADKYITQKWLGKQVEPIVSISLWQQLQKLMY